MKLNQIFPVFIVVLGFAVSTITHASDTNGISINAYDPGQNLLGQTTKIPEAQVIKFSNPLFHQAGDPVLGNPQGNISLVEFLDYQCSHCVEMEPVINALIAKNPQLRVIIKEFPIRGSLSIYAAKAALAAKKQGQFSAFHHALMQLNSSFSEETVIVLAKSLNLNIESLQSDMNGNSVDQQIRQNDQLAQQLQISGTPAFYLGKTSLPSNASSASIDFISGQVNQQSLQDLINRVGRAE